MPLLKQANGLWCPMNRALLLAPLLWTGLEYFRGEVYKLRFTWLTFGSAFWRTPELAHGIGVYGLRFACLFVFLPQSTAFNRLH